MRAGNHARNSASAGDPFTESVAAAPIASVLVPASALAADTLRNSSQTLRHAQHAHHDPRHARRHGPHPRSLQTQGSSITQFVRGAAPMRTEMPADDDPNPRRATAADRRSGIRVGRVSRRRSFLQSSRRACRNLRHRLDSTEAIYTSSQTHLTVWPSSGEDRNQRSRPTAALFSVSGGASYGLARRRRSCRPSPRSTSRRTACRTPPPAVRPSTRPGKRQPRFDCFSIRARSHLTTRL
jgi:hypothetical protein